MRCSLNVKSQGREIQVHPEPPAPQPERQAITRLLKQVSGGDPNVFDLLVPLVCEHLRRMASGNLQNELPGHTLRATALVHEAYLKLTGSAADWQDPFFAMAARVSGAFWSITPRFRAAH